MNSVHYNKRFYTPIIVIDVGIVGVEKYIIIDKNNIIHTFFLIGNIYKVCLITPKGNKITGIFGEADDYYMSISGIIYPYSNLDIVVICFEKT